MTIYLDSSALIPLFVNEAHTSEARRLQQLGEPFVVSPWTLAECSSAFARLHRMRVIDSRERETLDHDLDEWTGLPARLTAVAAEDFAFARTCLRTSKAALRAPDALHLAIVSRQGYALATFDDNLASAGRDLSLRVVGR